jgi:hypothetical protein
MDHPLDGVHGKLERAHENIVNLEREIRAFLETGPYPVIPNDDPKVIQEALKAHANRVIPIRFSVLSGEIIHQLRSCLDHIAWQLSPQQRRESAPTAIEFPIFISKPADKDTIKGYERKVKGISDCGLRLIESLQPYHRDPSCALTGPANHALWIIHDLDRIDKHRELIITLGAFDVAAGWEADLYLMLHRESNFSEEHVASLGRAFDPNSKITSEEHRGIEVPPGTDRRGRRSALPQFCSPSRQAQPSR